MEVLRKTHWAQGQDTEKYALACSHTHIAKHKYPCIAIILVLQCNLTSLKHFHSLLMTLDIKMPSHISVNT